MSTRRLFRILPLLAVAGLAGFDASAEWRGESEGQRRIEAGSPLTDTAPITYSISVDDKGGGVVTAQADHVLWGHVNAKGKAYGWYSYSTNGHYQFTYEHLGDVLNRYNDFKSATLSDKERIGSFDAPMGEVDLMKFKAAFAQQERSCVMWQGYINGNRGLLRGYVCAAEGVQATAELATDALKSIRKR